MFCTLFPEKTPCSAPVSWRAKEVSPANWGEKRTTVTAPIRLQLLFGQTQSTPMTDTPKADTGYRHQSPMTVPETNGPRDDSCAVLRNPAAPAWTRQAE